MTILQEHLVSALQTFLASFLTALGAQITLAGHLEWTYAFWIALILAAARAAVKEVFARFAPTSLGGRK